ncbi:LrgA family protein [Dorea sp. D27]|nr:LrgA family protein [Dorea sp. D27]
MGVLYMNMKILRQLGIILALCLAAEFIVSMLPIAFPSSVTAILILAALLGLKLLQEGHIQETADFMLSNMAIVFVPVSIGMVEDIGLLKGRMKGFLIVVCVSLVLTFLGTYVTVRIVQICMERLAGKGGVSDE